MNREHWHRRALILLGILVFTTLATAQHDTTVRAASGERLAAGVGKCGELQIVGPKGQVTSACPLKHTSVTADVPGCCARVNVVQEFVNPTNEKIEAVYVFPLPNDAAVDDMEMQVGSRTIKGNIKEREEAKRIYEQAREQGHVAALLDQERPNIFTQSVANIMPGEKVTVKISYLQILGYEDGYYEFVFPMVVGPRYMPGNPAGNNGGGMYDDTDRVPDASKISPPITPKGIRAGHDISVQVNLTSATPITGIISKQHQIDIKRIGKTGAAVSLRQNDTIPNKDFILRYSAGGKGIETGVLTHTRADGDGFFMLTVQPPARPQTSQIIPKEMVFVIDSSGSMMGEPIEKAKETMDLCIRQMNPYDTFQLMSFSNDVVKCFDTPVPNTPDNQLIGLSFLRDRMGSGGTEMMKPIQEALGAPADGTRMRIVCFMTDGYVGNDMEILDAIKKNLGDARVFAFGVGSSVNRYLLDGMAKVGKGAVEYVTLGEPGAEAANRFYDRIGNPMLTDIKIDWGGLPVTQIYPETAPDLFAGKPLIIKGRYSKPGSGRITISGTHGEDTWTQTIDVSLPASDPTHAALPTLWAREYIGELMEQDLLGIQQGKPNAEIKDSIIKCALEFHQMSQYTSFVAVEEKTVTQGGKPVKVMVPVEMPQGVSYEGIFGDREEYARNVPVRGVAKSAVMGPASPAGPSGYGGYGGASVQNYAYAMPAPSASAQSPSLGLASGLEMGSAAKRLDPALEVLMTAWAKDGKAPKDCKAKINAGKAQVMIWVSDVTPENVKKLKDLGCDVKASSAASKGIIAWAPIEKLKDISELQFVQNVLIPEYGGGKTAR